MSWPPPDPRERAVGPRGGRAAPGRPANGRYRPVDQRPHPGRGGPAGRPPAPGRPWAQPPRARADLGTDPLLPPGRVWWGTGETPATDPRYGPPGHPPAPGYDLPFGPPPPGADRRPPAAGPGRPAFRPPAPAPFVRRPGPPPSDRPEVRRIVQGRRLTGPIPDPRSWAAAPDPSPFAPPAHEYPEDRYPEDRYPETRWERETDWSGGYAPLDDEPDADWRDGYDDGPDEWELDDDPLDEWAHDERYDADWADDETTVDRRFATAAAAAAPGAWADDQVTIHWQDDGWAERGWPQPRGAGDVVLDPLGPGNAFQPGPRRRKRGRGAVWLAAAAVVTAAIAVPVALKAGPSSEPLAVELLGRDNSGETGKVRLSGWMAEGPNGEPPAMRVEIDGRTVEKLTANGVSRQRWEWRGPQDERGFGIVVPVPPGSHRVCVIAVADGRAVQCADVQVPAEGADGGGANGVLPGGTPPTSSPALPPLAGTTTSSTAAPTVPPTPPAPTTAPVPPPPVPTAPTAPPRPPVDTSWQAQMVDAVNAERAKLNLAPMAACGSLTRSAQGYAETMSAAGHFDHTGPDGSTMTSRTRAAGYSGRSLAENIARGQTSVAAVMAGWMGSTGHRANILNPGLTHIGVGRAAGNYWVQNFGSGGTC
jgi:uncharacterized protein YkwD